MIFKDKSGEQIASQKKEAESLLGFELKSKYPQDYKSYLQALRSLAREKKINEEPDLEKLSLELAGADKYISLSRKINLFKENPSFAELSPHQKEAYQAVADAFRQGLSSGFVKMPTGSGKTVVFSKLVEAIIGNKEENLPTPKILILTPGKDLTDQTVGWDYNQDDLDSLAEDFPIEDIIKGENNKEVKEAFRKLKKIPQGGLARFANQINVLGLHSSVKGLDKKNAKEFISEDKNSDHDVLVMTYQSFRNLNSSGEISRDFDFVICDEAHRALGEKTSKEIQTLSGVKLAFTATDEFSDGRKVEDLFGQEIFSMELTRAIEEKIVACPLLRVVETGVEIELDIANGDYTAKSLESLREKEEWFMAAVSEVVKQVESGRQGLVSCCPSQNLEEAKMMAEALNSQEIKDVSGNKRKIVAAVADGSMDYETRKILYAKYEKGEIDCLTFVDVLREGWDSEAAKFIVNMRPTASKVVAVQRLGRILRMFRKKTGETPTPVVIELNLKIKERNIFDDCNRNPVTAMDVLGITEYNADGQLYGTQPDRSQSDFRNHILKDVNVPREIEMRGSWWRPSVFASSFIQKNVLLEIFSDMKEKSAYQEFDGYAYYHKDKFADSFLQITKSKLSDSQKESDNLYFSPDKFLQTIGFEAGMPAKHPLSSQNLVSLGKSLAPILEKKGVFKPLKIDNTGQTILKPELISTTFSQQFKTKFKEIFSN